MEVLPYLKGLNVTGLGKFMEPLMPIVQSVSVALVKGVCWNVTSNSTSTSRRADQM